MWVSFSGFHSNTLMVTLNKIVLVVFRNVPYIYYLHVFLLTENLTHVKLHMCSLHSVIMCWVIFMLLENLKGSETLKHYWNFFKGLNKMRKWKEALKKKKQSSCRVCSLVTVQLHRLTLSPLCPPVPCCQHRETRWAPPAKRWQNCCEPPPSQLLRRLLQQRLPARSSR